MFFALSRNLAFLAIVSQLATSWAFASGGMDCNELLKGHRDSLALRRLDQIVRRMDLAAKEIGRHPPGLSVGARVYIGKGENQPFKVGLVSTDGEESIHSFDNHVRAQIKNFYSEDWVSVEVTIDGRKELRLVRVIDLEIKGDHIPPRLLRAMAEIPQVDREFSVGEKVRVRINGGMRTAKIHKVTRSGYEVRYRGEVIRFSRDQVFAHLGGFPKSVSYSEQAKIPPLSFPSGALVYWLDAIARFTSLKDFSVISRDDQMLLLMKAVRTVLPWKDFGLISEERGHRTISDSLLVGYGVCRHLAPMTAAVFNETGLMARVMFAFTDVSGHTWTEVLEEDGSEWIADPSSPHGFVGRRKDFEGLHDKFVQKYYSNPNRDYVIFKSYCPLQSNK